MSAVVEASPTDAAAADYLDCPHVDVLQRAETDGPQTERSQSHSERLSRDGEEKDMSVEVSDFSEVHRESVYDDVREQASPDELRPSEVLRVGSEIDSFVNRNRQASVAHLKLRPQSSFASHTPPDHQPELYDVVTHAVIRKNSLLGIHTEVKQVALGDEWVEPFMSGDPHAPTPVQINVARLSMSVQQAKAKLDGTSSKILPKHDDIEIPPTTANLIVEPGTEAPVAKSVSPKAKVPEHKGAAASTASPAIEDTMQLAMNKQRQSANSGPPRKELMRKSDSKEEEDTETRAVRILLPARFAPAELAAPPSFSKSPLKPILKPCPIEHNGLASLLRQEAYIAKIMDRCRMKVAAKFMKYNLQGKPNSRYFYITEDGTELHWTKTNPAKGRNNHSLTAEKPRKRYFADVRGVYYGPYNNRRVFRRFLDNKDQFEGSGKDWLCITVAFDDRTLDFCCTTDEQVSTWFLCMQALAPLAASYLTCGSVLWRRLIMKLNAYGLNPDRWPGPLKDPPTKGGRKK